MEGHQPYLGDLLTMVINHLLTGMVLQVAKARWSRNVDGCRAAFWWLLASLFNTDKDGTFWNIWGKSNLETCVTVGWKIHRDCLRQRILSCKWWNCTLFLGQRRVDVAEFVCQCSLFCRAHGGDPSLTRRSCIQERCRSGIICFQVGEKEHDPMELGRPKENSKLRGDWNAPDEAEGDKKHLPTLEEFLHGDKKS